MFDGGYIKLYRKIQGNFLWTERREFSKAEAWIDILMEANYSAKTATAGDGAVECGRGQSINSLDTWQRRWRWNSKTRVRRFLLMLQDSGMVRYENETKTVRITVCNYDAYNSERNESETQTKQVKQGKRSSFVPPTVEEVAEYVATRTTKINPNSFVDFYTSKEWKIGKNRMADWRAAVRTWESKAAPSQKAEMNTLKVWSD